MVDVSDEILEKAKKTLANLSDHWGDGVCKGDTMYLDGRQVVGTHGACHSWVSAAFGRACYEGGVAPYHWNDKPYKEDAVNFLVLSCHSRKRCRHICSGKASDFLVLWMAKESPFSKFILNRGDDENLTTGGVVILCGPDGATIAEAMWICKVLRFITEGSKAAETFMTLVKGGANPLLAVLVASHVRTVKGATFGYTGLDGHSTVFSQYGGAPDVIGLLTANVNRNAANTATVFVAPAGANKKFGKVANPETKIKGFCKPYEKDDGWGGKVKGTGATGEDLVARVLEWQKEIGGDFLPITEAPASRLPNANTVYLDLDM